MNNKIKFTILFLLFLLFAGMLCIYPKESTFSTLLLISFGSIFGFLMQNNKKVQDMKPSEKVIETKIVEHKKYSRYERLEIKGEKS